MNFTIWAGIILALVSILVIARKNLWLAMVVGGLIIGIFNLDPCTISLVFRNTLTDPSVVFLALAVGVIALIGGVMEMGGMMDSLVHNLRLKRKTFLSLTPAMVGLLPMPGGALLSAPIVKGGGGKVPDDLKSAINVWYRHIFVLIYPLATLLPICKIANINVYQGALYAFPGFIVLWGLGHFFLIRPVRGEMAHRKKFNLLQLLTALFIIVTAPLLHVSFQKVMNEWKIFTHSNSSSELALLLGVLASLGIALYFTRIDLGGLGKATRRMKPWNFTLIILGMFLFLNMFNRSSALEEISALDLPITGLLVGVGALLGFVTGRVAAPFFMIYPIYRGKYIATGESMDALPFMVLYFSLFIGYVISPVHPCLVVSQEYFGVSYRDMIKRMGLPALLALCSTALLSMVFL